jgi:hypothetical protein
MRQLRRRQVLALAGASLGLAACVEAEAGVLVTDTQVIHRAGDDRFDYPEDILYRISIENRGPDHQEIQLELQLAYDPATGEGRTWPADGPRVKELTIPRGTSVREEFIFENVFEEGRSIDDYSLDATLARNREQNSSNSSL